MTEDQVYAAVRDSTLEVLPELDPAQVSLDGTLSDLGANSIDRADIVTLSMERLGIAVPVAELGRVHDIRSLVTVLHQHA